VSDLHLDGNGIAGLLGSIFTVEMTSVIRRCATCGASSPLAAHRVYGGAGIVVRCPNCDDVALRVGTRDDGVTLAWTGVLDIRLPPS
jgi:Zn finger protein HypA/HybF involved in hydrogenase expression